MDQSTGRVCAITTELTVADAFVALYRGRLHFHEHPEDEDTVAWIVNGVIPGCTSDKYPPDAYAPGGYVPDRFIISKITALVRELTADADAATQIRAQSYSFIRGVFALLCSDRRLSLEWVVEQNSEFPLPLAEAVVERDFPRVRELLQSPRRLRPARRMHEIEQKRSARA